MSSPPKVIFPCCGSNIRISSFAIVVLPLPELKMELIVIQFYGENFPTFLRGQLLCQLQSLRIRSWKCLVGADADIVTDIFSCLLQHRLAMGVGEVAGEEFHSWRLIRLLVRSAVWQVLHIHLGLSQGTKESKIEVTCTFIRSNMFSMLTKLSWMMR